MHVSQRSRFLACASGLLCGVLVLGLPAVQATTYYVDQDSRGGSCSNSNPGTITQPRCTVDAGVQLLHSGDTLYIRAARYVDQSIGQYGPTPVPNGSSWETATTIAAYPGEDAWFYNTSISMINGNSYIIFDRLKLEWSSLYMDCSAHHIRFQNGIFTQVAPGGNGNMVQGAGDYAHDGSCTGAHHLELLNNEMSNAGGGTNGDGCPDIGSSDPLPWCYAMYWSGHHSLFDGNVVHGIGQYGFHIYHAFGTDVTDNVVSNNVFYENGIASAQRGTLTCSVIIANGARNKAYNNLFFNGKCGLQVGNECNDCEAYNNTSYGHDSYGITVFGNTGVFFANNVSYNNGIDIDLGVSVSGSGNWTTANGAPGFVNAPAGDFHLQSTSPLINSVACLNREGTTTDLKNVLWPNSPGLPRPQSPTPAGSTPCEPGVYEFQQGTAPPACPAGCATGCPAACPTVCATTCPTDQTPTVSPVIVSTGGHGDTPSDSNGCRTAETPATPKATIASALSCMTVASKKLWLRGGTHSGFVDTGTTPITGGPNWSAPTIIESYPGESAVLQLPATNTGGTLFFRAVTDRYIKVQRLTADGMSRAAGAGGADGILIYADAQFLRFENLTVRNDRFHNVAIIGASDIDFLTNTFTNALDAENIRTFYGVQNVLISGNTLSGSPAAGVLLDPTGDAQSVIVAKNTLSGTTVGVDVGTGTGTLLQNNVIQGESGNGIRIRTGASGTKVYHNDSVSNTGAGMVCDTGANGVDIANNIAVANTAGQLVNNCAALNRGNVLTGTLAEIFTTVPVLKDTAPFSPAINSGVDLPSVTDDQIGNARPFAARWDAGAREAQSAPAPGPTTGVSIRVMMFF
jgi:Right handed beta helix region